MCIYHANCMDGFTAAWVVARAFPDVELIAATYGDEPPDDRRIGGRHVLIVDFSYGAEILNGMGSRAKTIVVLDHHKTAEAELRQFECGAMVNVGDRIPDGDVSAHFDMGKSGARLAWEYVHGADAQPPPIVSYVEDRDLWRWQLPESRAINAALGAYTNDLEQWDLLNASLELAVRNPEGSLLTFEGRAILLQRDKDVDACIDAAWRWMVIAGQRVPVANAPHFLASDVANRLAEGAAFSATYFDNSAGERVFSLRSQTGGADVSAIAKRYGGGGHQHAAGFKMPMGWEGDA